jgi:CheY-like chemotaxis protein
MGIKPTMVLLAGETARSSLQLMNWLYKRGCQCHFAASYQEACNLISRTQFDLVLSQYQLPDRTAFPLLDWLAGSPATLFLSTAVENGCLWLPMLERGRRCVGAPLLRSNDLTGALGKVLNTAVKSGEMKAVAEKEEIGKPSLLITKEEVESLPRRLSISRPTDRRTGSSLPRIEEPPHHLPSYALR